MSMRGCFSSGVVLALVGAVHYADGRRLSEQLGEDARRGATRHAPKRPTDRESERPPQHGGESEDE